MTSSCCGYYARETTIIVSFLLDFGLLIPISRCTLANSLSNESQIVCGEVRGDQRISRLKLMIDTCILIPVSITPVIRTAIAISTG